MARAPHRSLNRHRHRALVAGKFFIGDTVGFTDKHLRERIGIIVRLIQKTASIACNDTEGHWRVSFRLLRHIVDV